MVVRILWLLFLLFSVAISHPVVRSRKKRNAPGRSGLPLEESLLEDSGLTLVRGSPEGSNLILGQGLLEGSDLIVGDGLSGRSEDIGEGSGDERLVEVDSVLSNNRDSEAVGDCLTSHCKNVVSRILKTMDKTKDPCDDFYQYACGNWAKNNPIPDMFGGYNSFFKLRQEVEESIRDLLEEVSPPNEAAPIAKAKHIYHACKDEKTIEARGAEPLRRLVSSLGTWPILAGDSWEESSFDFLDMLVKVRKNGVNALMNFYVGTDYKEPTKRTLKIDQVPIKLPSRSHYHRARNSTILMAYEDYVYGIAEKLGVPPAVARNEAKALVDFQIKLAKLTMRREDRRNNLMGLYRHITIDDLKRDIPEFDWLKYVNGVMEDTIDSPLTDEEPIVVLTGDYLRNMLDLVNRTSKRTVANYLMSCMVQRSIMDLSSDFRKLTADYTRQLYGVKKDLPRWHTCVKLADRAVPSAVGRLFVERHFDELSKQKVTEMISVIADVMKNLLDQVDWMDDSTTNVAKEKADQMVNMIGYPNRILDDEKLANEYSRLKVDRTHHFENVLQSVNFHSGMSLGKLRQPVDRQKWGYTRPADVNAYYDTTKNSLVFPAAILQAPFYDKDYPNYMNFGGIGMVIGHEITHGFDDVGRQFDGDGKLHHWWDKQTIDHFKGKKQCIIEQYGNYTLKSIQMKVRGGLTQGENIADNGGLKQAYMAYERWVSEHGPDPRLPGLNLTQTQLFFLNFAQMWCSEARPATARIHISLDTHSPPMFRVIGPLSNLNAFAEAYKCPVGSRMNPTKKCKIW